MTELEQPSRWRHRHTWRITTVRNRTKNILCPKEDIGKYDMWYLVVWYVSLSCRLLVYIGFRVGLSENPEARKLVPAAPEREFYHSGCYIEAFDGNVTSSPNNVTALKLFIQK